MYPVIFNAQREGKEAFNRSQRSAGSPTRASKQGSCLRFFGGQSHVEAENQPEENAGSNSRPHCLGPEVAGRYPAQAESVFRSELHTETASRRYRRRTCGGEMDRQPRRSGGIHLPTEGCHQPSA